MDLDRTKLPFRKNCEGYFIDNKENILAKVSEHGIVMFPGGGINEGENIEEGMLRETFEETGAIIINLKKLGDIKIIWGPNWAKTEKQKKRYEQFQGDHMYFFSGIVKEFINQELNEEDAWDKNKFIKIEEAINKIKNQNDSDKEILMYRKVQIQSLRGLKNEKT